MFNPVAKHAHKSNKALVYTPKKSKIYSRKKKHKKADDHV